MTESTPIPPPQAPETPQQEPVPVRGIFAAIDALLREPNRVMQQLNRPGAGSLVVSMLIAAILCNLIYGVVAGSFSGGTQLWAAPVKIAGGLLFSAFICLPSLYIFACLGGVRAGMLEVAGMIAGLLAIMSVLLVGFAPVAWVFSQSTESLPAMGGLHLAFGLVACFFGLRFLSAAFTHFKANSRAGLSFWTLVFLLVALQMTTALRPIIDTAPTFLPKEKKFFLTHWSDCLNAQPKPEAATVEAKK